MAISSVESDLYQKLRLLLKQLLFQTGIPHLKLDLEITECVISQSVNSISILESFCLTKISNRTTPAYLDYPYQLAQNIKFQEKVIGKVILNIPESDFPSSRFSEVFESLADNITRLLCRNKLKVESRKYFSSSLAWAGESDSLLKLEKNLERLSNKGKVFVISGEPSSGKIIAGCSLHIFNTNRESPFIITNCVDWELENYEELVDSLLQKSRNGTLYIRHFDLVSPEVRSGLVTKIQQSLKNNRVIFSISNESEQGVFDKMKHDKVIKIELPTLNQRSSDIKVLGEKFLDSFSNFNLLSVDDSCWNFLQSVKWNSGFEQFELLMFRLANYSNKSTVYLSDLMFLLPLVGVELAEETNNKVDKSIYDIAKEIARGDISESYNRHPAINKALFYVAKNFTKAFDLSMLARNACVSSSHLSFLLRSQLNINFKQLLNLCRIEKSMILLVEEPRMQITEISSILGFCDLSHFEKTFKKQIGNTPKEFRRTKKLVNHCKLQLVTENKVFD